MSSWLPFGREGADRTGPLAARLEAAEQQLADLGRRHDELSAAYERVCGALRSVSDGVEVCDEAGNVVFTNLGGVVPADEPLGESMIRQAVGEVLVGGSTGRSERRHVDLYGPPRRTLQVSGEPVTGHERHLGAVAVVHDVSDRERIDSIRRDFVSNISHELRTPVGALSVLAETMAAETSAAVLRRLAARIESEAQRLGRTIGDLLSLAQIEAAEGPRPEPCSLLDVIQEAKGRVTHAAEQRQIALVCEEEPVNAVVLGDRRQLVTAVSNLLDNGVKYSDPGSSVRVTVRLMGDDGVGGTSQALIEVTDDGIGIPARDRERIFERFYRVDRARARDTGGTGLGLAIVRHVAVNHGGEVTVRSIEGHGSTFGLKLPAVSPLGAVRRTVTTLQSPAPTPAPTPSTVPATVNPESIAAVAS